MSDPTMLSASPTKIAYVDGRATTITLRRVRLSFMIDGQLVEQVFDKDLVTLGTAPDNDLVLMDDTVSRNHCKIFLEGNHYMVRDLGSTNGTFVNRVRVREAWLKPDCVVGLGKSELRFAAVDHKMRVVPSNKERLGEMIGRNDAMREVYTIIDKIAPTDATVVIEGETGTGKEVVARTIHQQSERREGPFIVFDCGAVPENLIESELFGHEKGSFTGALTQRQGIFEMAHGGTVFLDELGELQIDLQPRLLRVLEQREVRRVGGGKPIKVDVRVVAATNRQLEKEVRAGRFREDLYYRLSVVRVELPPLKARKEDIPLLVDHFLQTSRFNQNGDGSQRIRRISQDAMARLMTYDWPGNVRELLNVVERAVSFADGEQVEVRDLPDHVALGGGGEIRGEDTKTDGKSKEQPTWNTDTGTFKDSKDRWVQYFERDYIEEVLRKNDGNISHAAREADIDRKYFRKLMKKYELG